jgi:hypothetical protein
LGGEHEHLLRLTALNIIPSYQLSIECLVKQHIQNKERDGLSDFIGLFLM